MSKIPTRHNDIIPGYSRVNGFKPHGNLGNVHFCQNTGCTRKLNELGDNRLYKKFCSSECKRLANGERTDDLTVKDRRL